MGNAIRGGTTIDGIPRPSHSCRRVSGLPEWPIGRYLRCFTGSAAAAQKGCRADDIEWLHLLLVGRGSIVMRRLFALMNSHPTMLVINTYLKFAFACQCECDCEWLARGEGATGNPICGWNAMQTIEMSVNCEMMALTMNNSSRAL